MLEQQNNIYKKILLQTMQDFIKLCEDNNIKYIAAYGTVLGAVRHKGLIPWDDDIDVYMKREDYNKFLSLRDKLSNSIYEIINHDNENYYLPFAKFCNKHTTIWEMEELPFVMGIFIDIFPLDYCPQNIAEAEQLIFLFKKHWSTYYRSLRKLTIKQYIESLKKLSIRSLIFDIRNCIYRICKKKMYSHFLEIENRIQSIKGRNYIRYTTANVPINRIVHHYSWIEETIEVPFENFYIRIPQDYHNYLTNEFGDYMKLPPIEMRNSNHFHYFIDLNQRLTIDEIRSLKRNEKHQSK